jgi:hypothetical protein
MNKFFSTAIGSYCKIFISGVLTLYMAEMSNGVDLFSFDWAMGKKLISAGVISILPVIYNSLNPHDVRYGNKKTAIQPTPKSSKIKD